MLNRAFLTPEFANIIADSILPTVKKQWKEAEGHRLWLEMIRSITPLEKKFMGVMSKYFDKQISVVLANMKRHPKAYQKKAAFDFWMFGRKDWDAQLERRGRAFMKEVTQKEGPRVMSQLQHMLPDAEGLAGVAFNVTNPNVTKYLNERSFKFAKDVNKTTLDELRRELGTGMNAGESMKELMARVASLKDSYMKFRSNMIARSETIRTANAAAEMSYVQSGVIEKKEWWTSGDNRTCGHCNELHGKIVAVNTNFVETGDKVNWKPLEE